LPATSPDVVRNEPLAVAVVKDGRHQYLIAAEARINPPLLSRIVAGREKPTAAVRARIAAALGLSEAELFPNVVEDLTHT
jgi:transcriptional regulator with XRE-family HTH domain